MYHLGFTDPYELEGKQTAASRSYIPICPYTHFLKERGLLKKFQDDYNLTRWVYPLTVRCPSLLWMPMRMFSSVSMPENSSGRWTMRFPGTTMSALSERTIPGMHRKNTLTFIATPICPRPSRIRTESCP